jgi:ABC-type transporter Mla subunit MlaD
VKVGILVIVSAVFLLVLIAITSDIGKFFRPKRIVDVAFRHVVGLQPNSPVNYSGVEVGRVRNITVITVDDAFLGRLVPIMPDMVYELPVDEPGILDKLRLITDKDEFDREARGYITGRDMVLLEMEVDASTVEVIHVDDYVSVESTLMGDTSVEISPGIQPAKSSDVVLLGRSGNLFTKLSESVEEIRYLLRSAGTALSAGGTDFSAMFSKINTSVSNLATASEDFKTAGAAANEILTTSKANVVDITRNTKSISERTDNILARVERDIDPITSNITVSADAVRQILDKVTPNVEPLISGTRRLTERLDSLAENSDKLVATTSEVIGDSRADIRRSTENMKDATRNLTELTSLVSRKPWLLLRAPRGEDRNEEDLISMARTLLEASSRAQEAATTLSSRQGTAAEKAELEKTAADLKETSDNLRRAAEAMIEVIKPLDRKGGGKGFEQQRKLAPEYPAVQGK